jgi:hypothetical protein
LLSLLADKTSLAGNREPIAFTVDPAQLRFGRLDLGEKSSLRAATCKIVSGAGWGID